MFKTIRNFLWIFLGAGYLIALLIRRTKKKRVTDTLSEKLFFRYSSRTASQRDMVLYLGSSVYSGARIL